MTRTPEILGPEYDAPTKLPEQLVDYDAKRNLALAALTRAEAAGDTSSAQFMRWEMGLLDLILTPAKDGSHFNYRGGTYEVYAEHYLFTEGTVAYARERANETRDLILKIHYLTFILLRSQPKGKPWIDLQREILDVYREYINGCVDGSKDASTSHVNSYINTALSSAHPLMSRIGVIRGNEQLGWAEWLLDLAEKSLILPQTEEKQYPRHRWIADYLEHLEALPITAVPPELRERALALLGDTAAFYEANPLNDRGSIRVAEVDAKLRRHWGEDGDKVHERKVRRMFSAIVRRAEFFQKTGNGSITAAVFRKARKLVEQERRFFTSDDVAKLQLAEKSALHRAVEAGEFTTYVVPIHLPSSLMDYTRETSEQTVVALSEEAVRAVPNRNEIAQRAREISKEAPLLAMLNRVVVGPGKVVGESESAQTNLKLTIESQAMAQARLFGTAVSTTAMRAAKSVGLTAADLVVPLLPLALDEGTLLLIKHGCDRLIAQDFISATHILVLRIEDVIRQHLHNLGVDIMDFKPDVGDGTSRTDDAPLGKLMRKMLPNGRSFEEYLGSDLWNHLDSVLNSQTGLNLRNDIAHGLVRPWHCTAESAGIALGLLYQLAYAVWLASQVGTK